MIGLDRRLLEKVAGQNSSGPAFMVDIAESSSSEQRVLRVAWPRHRFSLVVKRETDTVGIVRNAYIVCRGPWRYFRFRDRGDYTTARNGADPGQPGDQRLGIGDGTTTVFDLYKRYSIEEIIVERRLVKPLAGTVRIAANGVEVITGWQLQEATGRISFDAAPAPGTVLTWGGQFDVPVRFDVAADASGWRALMQDFDHERVSSIQVDLIEIAAEEVLEDLE
jgi:uncharacterized protein (TIGR02217 family)